MAEQGFTVSEIVAYTATTPETVQRVYLKVNPAGLRSISDGMGELLSPHNI